MQRLFVITKEKMKRICNPNGDSKMKLDDSKILTESDHNKMVQVQINNKQLTTDFFSSNLVKKKDDEYHKILFSKPQNFQGSVSEDLETFIETLGEKNMNMSRTTYHMSKMTYDEKELLARKDKKFLQSFQFFSSESDSKYVLSRCSRQTIVLNNSS